MPSQTEIRQTITDTIITALQSGGLPPWKRPWRCSSNTGAPANVISKKNYSGVNPLLLQISAQRHGFQSRHWATFAQWKQLGGSVMKRPHHVPQGKWGTSIVFCRPVTKKETDLDGEEGEKKCGAILKSYTVFNIDQVEGEHLDHLRAGTDTPNESEVGERFAEAQRFIDAIGADVRHGGDQAFFSPKDDYIQLPHRHQFDTEAAYFETSLHEHCHWAEKRVGFDRQQVPNAYAFFELVADLGASQLMAELNLPTSIENTASYLKTWLDSMKADPKFIFKAASFASKTADFLLSFSRTPMETDQAADELVAV